MNPRIKTFLIPFIVVDVVFTTALIFWLVGPRMRSRAISGKPNFQVQLRHPESKLTEIDVVNNGDAAGPVNVSVDISWPDADFVDAKGLSNYGEKDTSRRSLRFSPQTGKPVTTLSPGAPCAIGWVKLTDDVPVHAEIATEP